MLVNMVSRDWTAMQSDNATELYAHRRDRVVLPQPRHRHPGLRHPGQRGVGLRGGAGRWPVDR